MNNGAESAKVRTITLVIPVFNEAGAIHNNLTAIRDALTGISLSKRVLFDLLVVNDGSSDSTAAALDSYCTAHTSTHAIHFTRNFGKEAAILAGLSHAKGDAVIVMDSDLQHPPALIEQMVTFWFNGLNVVEAIKVHRGEESATSRMLAQGFYGLFHLLSGLNLRGQSDFKLLDRSVVNAYLAMDEHSRFFRGMIQWMGYPTAQIPFSVPERSGQGSSKWSRLKLLRYAMSNITAFSELPLHVVTWLGATSLAVGTIFGAISLVQKLQGHAIDGFTTTILLLIFFSGSIMISIGIIGHYLGRIYAEIKRRPTYLLVDAAPKKDTDR